MSQNSSRRQQTLPGWLTSLPSALFSIRHVRPLFFPDRTEGRESRSPCLQWLNTNTHACKGFVIKRCRSGSRFSPFPPTHTHTRILSGLFMLGKSKTFAVVIFISQCLEQRPRTNNPCSSWLVWLVLALVLCFRTNACYNVCVLGEQTVGSGSMSKNFGEIS